jgi:hypothetical protein
VSGLLRLGALGLAWLLLASLLGRAEAGEDLTPDEEKWARTLLQQLGANSPRVRRGAETALVQMGLDVLPVLVDGANDVKGAAREGLKRVLIGLSLPAVRAALEHMKAEGRGERQKSAAALLTELGGAVAAGTELRAPLKADVLQDPDVLPLAVLKPVGDRLPWPRAGASAARLAGAALEVDLDGDGKAETKVEPGAWRVVETGPASALRKVALVHRRGQWLAAPADVVRGELKGRAIEVLDADQDGVFGGEGDYVRWAGGAFGPARAPRRVLVEDAIAAYEVRRAGEGWEVAFLPEARPDGTPEEAWRCLVALNRLRQSLGIGPVGVDLVKCAGCRKHCEWLRLNTGTAATQGLSAHREAPGSPGYTEEGAAAGMSSILSSMSDPAAAVRGFFVTMLHRGDLLGDSESGFGVGAGQGGRGWTAIWGEGGTIRADGTPLVTPAPGQADVPLRGSGEEPPPDDPPDYYGRPHGFPISAMLAGSPFVKARLALYEADGVTPVAGRLWTPEAPISTHIPGNDGAAFFMPESPLAPKSAYVVDLTAEQGGKPVRWVWTFRTR